MLKDHVQAGLTHESHTNLLDVSLFLDVVKDNEHRSLSHLIDFSVCSLFVLFDSRPDSSCHLCQPSP